MVDNTADNDRQGVNRWRLAGWSMAAMILLLPLIAMQLTGEVAWDLHDFVFAGVLVLVTGGLLELAVRTSGSRAYRAAIGVALAGLFLLVWMNGAVGIIGNENNPANRMYGGVLAIAIIGTLIARARSRGMVITLIAMALAQAVIAVVALFLGHFTLILNGFFIALWLVSAWLFRKAGATP